MTLNVPAGGMSKAPVELTVPRDWDGLNARRAIAADVICNGTYLGQSTEGVVDFR